MSAPQLVVDSLSVEYPSGRWRQPPNRVLDDISFDVRRGETVGLVGESGSGKSTIGRAILGLAPITSGSIVMNGHAVKGANARVKRELNRELQVVFQDPYTSLNPSMTVEDVLTEPLRVQGVGRADASRRVRELLDRVRLPSDAARRLPREFSGGQRQRVAIARALAIRPRLIVCDEPVSALDLSTQATVLDLFIEIQRETGVSYLFVSHDLGVIRHMSHRVLVLYRGSIVERGKGSIVTSDPEHDYTRRLLMSSPIADPREQALRRQQRLDLIEQQNGPAAGVAS